MGAYAPSAEHYGKHGGLEHSKDGMSHSSVKNVSPAFDTGFYDPDHKEDPASYEGGSSPNQVKAPVAAR